MSTLGKTKREDTDNSSMPDGKRQRTAISTTAKPASSLGMINAVHDMVLVTYLEHPRHYHHVLEFFREYAISDCEEAMITFFAKLFRSAMRHDPIDKFIPRVLNALRDHVAAGCAPEGGYAPIFTRSQYRAEIMSWHELTDAMTETATVESCKIVINWCAAPKNRETDLVRDVLYGELLPAMCEEAGVQWTNPNDIQSSDSDSDYVESVPSPAVTSEGADK